MRLDAEGMANSADPEHQTAHLIWIFTVCPNLSIQKLIHPWGGGNMTDCLEVEMNLSRNMTKPTE